MNCSTETVKRKYNFHYLYITLNQSKVFSDNAKLWIYMKTAISHLSKVINKYIPMLTYSHLWWWGRAKCFNEVCELIQFMFVCIISWPVRNNEQCLHMNNIAKIK